MNFFVNTLNQEQYDLKQRKFMKMNSTKLFLSEINLGHMIHHLPKEYLD